MSDHRPEGGCFCGALRYSLGCASEGSMICHCATCRRLFAAPVVAWLSIRTTQFTFTRGTPAAFSTSPPVTRWFCADCGTHVAYVHADEPEYVEVATCSLDQPAAFPPTHNSWLSHDLAWVRFADGLPAHPRSRYTAD